MVTSLILYLDKSIAFVRSQSPHAWEQVSGVIANKSQQHREDDEGIVEMDSFVHTVGKLDSFC